MKRMLELKKRILVEQKVVAFLWGQKNVLPKEKICLETDYSRYLVTIALKSLEERGIVGRFIDFQVVSTRSRKFGWKLRSYWKGKWFVENAKVYND